MVSILDFGYSLDCLYLNARLLVHFASVLPCRTQEWTYGIFLLLPVAVSLARPNTLQSWWKLSILELLL